MKTRIIFSLFFVALMASDALAAAEKVKKKKSKKSEKLLPDSKMFDSATMKCLVCRSVVEEIRAEIYKVDPKKMIETGTFRVNEKGEQRKSIIPYARSQIHLMELVDRVCKNFEDYAQAKEKKTGKPTIIRLTTPQGNMNPKFHEVDLVPDADLNTKLKFHCESVVEDNEEDFLTAFAEENNEDAQNEICSKLCKSDDKKKKKKVEL